MGGHVPHCSMFGFTTVNLLKSAIAKLTMTELISKVCYCEYAQMKATKLKVVHAINKSDYNGRQLANPPKIIYIV